MEIIDYLRVARRRLWVLILVPLLAGGITAAIILHQPTQYTATATVAPPALVGGSAGNQYTGSQAVSQYVSAFQSTAVGPAVRQAVVATTKTPASKFADGLDVAQVGASSTMTVTFTSPDKTVVEPVVKGISDETLAILFGSQVQLAKAQVSSAQQGVTSANAAIAEWSKKNHMADPQRSYQSQLYMVNSLLQQQATQRAAGKPLAVAALSGSLADAKAGLTKYESLLADYSNLTASRDSAVVVLGQAKQSLQQAQSQLSAADPHQVAFIGGSHVVNKESTLLATALPVAGAGVFVAVFLIAILELLSKARRARREAEESAEREQHGTTIASAPATPRHQSGRTPVAEPEAADHVSDIAVPVK